MPYVPQTLSQGPPPTPPREESTVCTEVGKGWVRRRVWGWLRVYGEDTDLPKDLLLRPKPIPDTTTQVFPSLLSLTPTPPLKSRQRTQFPSVGPTPPTKHISTVDLGGGSPTSSLVQSDPTQGRSCPDTVESMRIEDWRGEQRET